VITSSNILAKEKPVRWPTLSGSPVLDSLRPVIENSRDVRTNIGKIIEVAGWMGYEELPLPEFTLPFGIGAGNTNEAIDFVLVADSIDTAFTDFSTHKKFQVDFAGQHWSDSDAEFACLKRALDSGKPILDGKYLAKISRTELDEIFAGNMKMPMLDENLQCCIKSERCWRKNTMDAFTNSCRLARRDFMTAETGSSNEW
jgi:hypothetical protein